MNLHVSLTIHSSWEIQRSTISNKYHDLIHLLEFLAIGLLLFIERIRFVRKKHRKQKEVVYQKAGVVTLGETFQHVRVFFFFSNFLHIDQNKITDVPKNKQK